MKEKRLSVAALLLFTSACRALPEGRDWPRFRGPNGSGVSLSRGLPSRLDPERGWKTAVPPGNSSPVIARGQLYLTAALGDERLVLAYDPFDGKPLWRKAFPRARDESANPMNGLATPTPAAGNGSVYDFFPDLGLLALGEDGEERWRAPLGPFRSLHGIASSPVLAGGNVVVLIDQLEGAYVAAFDARTGKPAWRMERASGVTGGYSTPTVSGEGGAAEVITSGAFELTSYSASSGERLWWVTGLTNAPVGLPVVGTGSVFVCEPLGERFSFNEAASMDKDGDGRISRAELGTDAGTLNLLERIDTHWGNGDGSLEAAEFEKAFGNFEGNGGLAAVRLGGKGDVTRTHVLWRNTKSLPYVPSVLLYEKSLFAVRDGGILTTYDPATGAVQKQARLEGAEGPYYASPVAGDGKVYLMSRDGKVSVVKADPEWELLSSIDLGETATATPALYEGRIYIRTENSLHCF